MRLDDVFAKFITNRLKAGDWVPRKGDILRIRPVCSLVPSFRLFRAIHDLSEIPSRLAMTLFGKIIPQLPWEDEEKVSCKEILPIVRSSFEDIVRVGVDIGCLGFLDSVPHSVCVISIRG